MSKTHDIQDATGVVVSRGPHQALMTVSTKTAPRYDTVSGIPQNGVAGFLPSCIVHNPFGSPGSLIYVNVGTVTSSLFFNLV